MGAISACKSSDARAWPAAAAAVPAGSAMLLLTWPVKREKPPFLRIAPEMPRRCANLLAFQGLALATASDVAFMRHAINPALILAGSITRAPVLRSAARGPVLEVVRFGDDTL